MYQTKFDAQPEARFSADELENSFPLDLGRKFSRPEGHSLLNRVLNSLRSDETRMRERNARAEERYRSTVEAMLANLVAAHLNVVDGNRFVGVSFNRNDYASVGLCRDTMARCRDCLLEDGLIEVAPGFHRWDADGIGTFGRRTRLRPSARMRALIDGLGIDRRTLTIPDSQLIRIKKAVRGLGLPSEEIDTSRDTIRALNRRLADAEIRLNNTFLHILRTKVLEDEGEDSDGKDRKRRYAGDLTAIAIYRSFTGDWNNGGRLYGGWWMSLPRSLRPYLTIDGSPVVELDFKTLHPLLLYRKLGLPLDFDPYVIPGRQSSDSRDLGKRTFNRLLNRRELNPTKRLTLRAAKGDRDALPKGITFKDYLFTFVHQLADVQQWFGTGEGIRLQREDSELALSIIKTMEQEGILVLPVHDSFLVAQKHEEALHKAMTETFYARYGMAPPIKAKRPRLDFPIIPGVHN